MQLSSIDHRYGSRDCGFLIQQSELDAFPESRLSVVVCGDSNIQEYLNFVMEQNHFQKPVCWESATELYMKLIEIANF